MKKLRWMIMICMMMALVGIGRVDVKAIDSDSGDGFLYFQNEDGTISISGYYGNEETIVFPSELDGKKVSTICIKQSKSWDRDTVKHIVISEGISEITLHSSGSYDSGAFRDCHNLKSVSLPSTLTKIGDYTFTFCKNLNHVILPEGLTEIGTAAFEYCHSLDKLEIPDSVVKIGDGAFFLGWLKYVPVYANSGSYAQNYFTENDIPFSCMEHKETVAMLEIPATCAKIGRTAGDLCTVCGTFANGGETIPATGHTVVQDPDIPATCTKPGKTKRSHCSVCSQIISHGEAIPLKAHTVVIDPPIPATCTLPGRSTAGSHCSICNTIISMGEATPPKGHSIVVKPGYPATCTTYGFSISHVCSVCGYTAVYGTGIHPTGHKIITTYTPPTCTQYSKSETYCEVCQQRNINEHGEPYIFYPEPPTGHRYDKGILNIKAGQKILTCTVCGEQQYQDIALSDLPQVGDIISNSQDYYRVLRGGLNNGTVAFYKTRRTKSHITIPDTVTINDITYKVILIDDNAFRNNKKITHVTIGKNVTFIGYHAFQDCSRLKSVTIGPNVNGIGKQAFMNCGKLKTLTVKSKKLSYIGKNALKGIHPKAKIKVPSKKLKKYKKIFKKKGQKNSVCITS